ncbi:hypothetical protein K439DRAFT_1649010 [Ramaria rubella]|nr:hypothetical protein K439DRAFT_1649010 [Ramaria rubella]
MRGQKGCENWEGVHYVCRLHANARHVLQHGFLPKSQRGHGAKHHSLLDREDVRTAIKNFIKGLGVGKIFALLGLHDKTNLGYTKHCHRKGVYVDSHEYKDVVEYQQTEPLPLVLPLGQRHHHFIFQDESTFHANDIEDSVYMAPGEQQLRHGQLVHVSDFILESTGHLVLPAHLICEIKLSGRWTDHLNASAGDARKIIYLGKNYDPWWDMKQLIKQVSHHSPECCYRYFNILHPNDVAVFFFDCSSAHEVFDLDVLLVQRMNVKPGGNQPVMHDTIIPDNCPIPSKWGTIQSMVFTAAEMSDPKLIGVPKGMAIVCNECGLTPIITAANKSQVVGTCHLCKLSATKRAKLEEDACKWLENDGERTYIDEVTLGLQSNCTDCCLSRALGSQKDFSSEKSMLETVKFSEVADGTFVTAQCEVSKCLDKCNTTIIRHFFRKCYRYMDAYQKGLLGKEAEHVVRKYKSHHKVGRGIVMNINMIMS